MVTMNETEIKVVEYLAECLKEIEDGKDCNITDMKKYEVIKGIVNAIVKDITTGEYKK